VKLQVRGDKLLVSKMARGKAELRLGLLLGRFGDEVVRVSLRLSKAARPGGGVNNRCQIAIGLKPKAVRVEHASPDLLVAFERAADKAVRSVVRVLDREREQNPAKATAANRALEAARVLAAARVLKAAAESLRALRTPKTARTLENARKVAAALVQETARALPPPRTPKGAKLLDTARVLAADRVRDTARMVKQGLKPKDVTRRRAAR